MSGTRDTHAHIEGCVPRDSQKLLSRSGANFFDLHLDHHHTSFVRKRALARVLFYKIYDVSILEKWKLRREENRSFGAMRVYISLLLTARNISFFTKLNPMI